MEFDSNSQAIPERVRFRTILLGILLIYLAGLWIFGGEMGGGLIRRYTYVTAAVPFCTAVYMLFLLSLANLWLRQRLPHIAFNRLELLTLYIMVSVGSAFASFDTQGALVTLMGYPAYFAGQGNEWNKLFAGALPHWLMVTDLPALIPFYKGGSTLFTPAHIAAWLKPVAAWTCFFWAMLAMMMCAGAILRKAWAEQERLAFPIIAMPLAMADQPEAFFRNRLMWIGFAVSGGIVLLNGLAMFFPSIPYIPVKRRNFYIGPVAEFSELRVGFYFFAIALGFLMPLDLSTSLWVFYILMRIEQAGTFFLGSYSATGFPYVNSQTFGAYMAIFCTVMWGLRGHLKNVWRTAMEGCGSDEDAREPMRYRRAIIGFALTSIVMILFARMAGMPGPVAAAFFGIWLAFTIVLTRLRAEFGFPVHDMYRVGPDQTLTVLLGPSAYDRQTLGAFTLFGALHRNYSANPMPHQVEALKMAGIDASARAAVFRAMAVAGFIAVPLVFVIYINGIYHFGAATAQMNKWGTLAGSQAFGRLESWLTSPLPVNYGEGYATGFGFLFTLALAYARRHIVNFPLHPLGYAVANSYGMYYLAFPIMIGSLCKAAIVHISGLTGVRKATMFFFGLMLGEFVIGSTWTVIGLVFGIQTYDYWP